MKIAVNKCFGGFSVTAAVFAELGREWDGYGHLNNESFEIKSGNYLEWRKHPQLISAIEKIGTKASSGMCAEIEVVDIPDDIEWFIDEYDGFETIREMHRSW